MKGAGKIPQDNDFFYTATKYVPLMILVLMFKKIHSLLFAGKEDSHTSKVEVKEAEVKVKESEVEVRENRIPGQDGEK